MGTRLCKIVVFISAIALIPMATISHAEETGQCKNWVASVAAVVGKVDAKRHGQQAWTPVLRNNTYCAGDQIRADKASKATLVFTNETLVTLDEHTAITINQVENDGPSILELVKGIAHFISRVPRSLKVNTPFVNAAIEGTEFVVEVGDNETNVTVFEGTVLTANQQGELRVTNNETSKTLKGEAPQKILMARPRDAVQWAIYFPPVAKGEKHDEQTTKSKAHAAITAIVNNQDNALALAKEAVELAPDAAANHIALSYAWQSKFNLPKAIDSAVTATEKEPDNAIAWARLAEMQLSIGELSRAQDSATKASALDADNARAQTILGYAYLTQIKIANARETFEKAIELDQSDPLPHLGLGLAMIRKNELKQGRREIEIAAALDPNNSIIRSYLGKAYYEEKRGPLDADQFEMAKALDPNDPTPYFYDAIRKQTENDPIGALKDINKSIELNDNRAVYRSSLQLDQDEAARSVSLARIYQDLGFEQTALLEGWKSVISDPANHSAHRFLADSYTALPRHELASASELLQSQLLQPLNTIPIRPQQSYSDLGILSGTGPSDSSFNEYTPLFSREETRVQFDVIGGGNNTFGNDLVVSGMSENTAFSIGQFKYKTDGYRENNDLEHDIFNAFLQYKVSDRSSLQFEYQNRSTDQGDRVQSITGDFGAADRRTIDTDTTRIGYNYKISSNSNFLISISDNNEKDVTHIERNQGIVFPFPNPLIVILDNNSNQSGITSEIQYLHTNTKFKYILGAGNLSRDRDRTVTSQVFTGGAPLGPSSTVSNSDKRQNNNIYSYNNLTILPNLTIILGASYDDFNSQILKERDLFSPKLGVIVNISNDTTLRLAAFKSLTRATLNTKTIEPSQVAGFNQFFNDFDGVVSTRYGIALDSKSSNNVAYGIELTGRELTYAPNSVDIEQYELLHRVYLNSIISKNITVSASYIFDRYESKTVLPSMPDMVRTQSLPISVKLTNSNGIHTGIIATGVDQETRLSSTDYREQFISTDVWVGYRFPNRRGEINLLLKNITNSQFNFQDRNFQTSDPAQPQFVPDRTLYLNLNLTL
ncbi:FIG00860065: hypothetical protein [hydrothermal vent metagenome]|uniref:FecR protein domain-containing protein n=1 Tax=hydrothermal vent metagenome TaxID=652676 RepID=A0A3B0ZTK3_9ZZZZ